MRKRLTNDSDREWFLRTVIRTSSTGSNYGEVLMDSELALKAEALLSKLKGNQTYEVNAQLKRTTYKDDCYGKLKELADMLRVVWGYVDAMAPQVRRSELLCECYGLSGEGVRPKVSSPWKWPQIVDRVLKGEVLAEANGLPKVSAHVDVEAIRSSLEVAERLMKKYQTAKLEQTEASAALAQTREAIHAYYVKVGRYFDYVMSDEPASRRRSVMRRYGIRFDGATDRSDGYTGEASDVGSDAGDASDAGSDDGGVNGDTGEGNGTSSEAQADAASGGAMS